MKKIGLWAKQLGKGLSKLPSACPEEYWEDFSLKEGWHFIFFAPWGKLLLPSAKYLWQGFRNFNLRVRRKILREKKWQKDDFLVILYFDLKILDFGQNNLAGVVKAASGVSRGIFWAFFFGKSNDFRMIFALWAKKFRTLPNYYGRVSETSIYVYEEEFWEEKIEKKDDFLVILYFDWKKLNFGQHNSAGVIKAVFGVSRGIFWEFFIEKNDVFWMVFVLWAKKFQILPKLYGRVSETSSYVSREKLWERKTLKKWWFLSNFVLWN